MLTNEDIQKLKETFLTKEEYAHDLKSLMEFLGEQFTDLRNAIKEIKKDNNTHWSEVKKLRRDVNNLQQFQTNTITMTDDHEKRIVNVESQLITS